MMIYIRKLLTEIRKRNAHLTKRNRVLSVIAWVAVCICSVLVDLFLPFNYFTNILRAALALAIGFYLFAMVYLIIIRRNEKKRSESDELLDEESFRDRFSYSQRVNISVILWGVFILLALMGAKPNPTFTIFSGLLIFYSLGILSFVRSTRDETQNASIGFRDPRDVVFEEQVEAELRLRKEMEEKQKRNDD